MNDDSTKTPKEETGHKERIKSIRSLIFFILGLVAFIHEAFFVPEIRIEIVAASLALMGLPAVLKADEVRRNGN